MLLRRDQHKGWRAAIVTSAAVYIALGFFKPQTAAANDVLFRGSTPPFSTEALVLSDDELANSRAMGADTSLSLDLGAQQRFSVILWDDLKRQSGQGSGGISGNTTINVTTAQ